MKIYFILHNNIKQNGNFLQMFNTIKQTLLIAAPKYFKHFLICSKITKSSLLSVQQTLNYEQM